MNNNAFTLIELLVVIAILAVLAVAVTLILNPAELIRQGRDSTRLSDLATINRALGLYQTDQIAKWMGTSTVVYTSLPDTTSTCASYGLPSLPSGWEYNCVQESSSTKVDGNGWLPVDFTSMSFSSPLARLPLDPVNEATSSKYYTYVSGGSWELSALMEASSNKLGGDNDRVSGDGGEYPDVYETGTNLELLPVNRNPNLVGYWEFDEGSGLSAYDASGNGSDGTLTNGPTWTTGKKGGAIDFDGSNDYVEVAHDDSLNSAMGKTETFTLSAWIYPTQWVSYGAINKAPAGCWYDSTNSLWTYSGGFRCIMGHGGPGGCNPSGGGIRTRYQPELNNWYHVTCTGDGTDMKMYVNGEKVGTKSISDITVTRHDNTAPLTIGRRNPNSGGAISGTVDDVRIYNRALSAAEIEAMYNSY